MTYLKKKNMNIAPTENNISLTERQNLQYSVLLGFIFSWDIVITKKCSEWGSSYVFIKSQNSDNLHQNNDSP